MAKKSEVKKEKSGERGIAFLLVVILLSALLATGVGIANIIFGQFAISGEIASSLLAMYAADQGVERALYCNRHTPAPLCATGGGSIATENSRAAAPALSGGALARDACYITIVDKTIPTIVTIASVGQHRIPASQTACIEDPSVRIVQRRFEVVYTE